VVGAFAGYGLLISICWMLPSGLFKVRVGSAQLEAEDSGVAWRVVVGPNASCTVVEGERRLPYCVVCLFGFHRVCTLSVV